MLIICDTRYINQSYLTFLAIVKVIQPEVSVTIDHENYTICSNPVRIRKTIR